MTETFWYRRCRLTPFMCFSHCAWPLKFSGASKIPTGDLLISEGESWKGEVDPKEDKCGLEGVSSEIFPAILPVVENPCLAELDEVLKHNDIDDRRTYDCYPVQKEEE